jgi:hypothetical protein
MKQLAIPNSDWIQFVESRKDVSCFYVKESSRARLESGAGRVAGGTQFVAARSQVLYGCNTVTQQGKVIRTKT